MDNPLLIEYHDKEWGRPLFDDNRHFEYLSLETMQCGVSWLTLLKKRNIFRKAFFDFDVSRVALYDDKMIEKIMAFDWMIRSPRKIKAIINNAKVFIGIQKEWGSFLYYLWHFTSNKIVVYPEHINETKLVSRNDLSNIISMDLKARGFSHLGPVTVYSHLQASGIIKIIWIIAFVAICLKMDMAAMRSGTKPQKAYA